MKKSIKFVGVVKLPKYRPGNVTIDTGSKDYEIETPFDKDDLKFLEGKCVEIKIKNVERG